MKYDPEEEMAQRALRQVTRRHFLRDCTYGLGGIALGMLGGASAAADPSSIVRDPAAPMAALPPHVAARARHVIYLHMAGAPSQLELFDPKPELERLDGLDCPNSLLEGKRFAFIEGIPKMLGPRYPFRQYGQSGTWVSDRLPHFSRIVDEVSVIRTMYTEEFNHAPAQLLLHTGFPRLGRPSMGSWVVYGLGSENRNLPGFVVLVSGGKTPSAGKSVWGSGFLPTVYQGVQCRAQGEPVLYSENPPGVSREARRRTLDAVNRINRRAYGDLGDPEILTRIAQYEMAFRMQMAVPEAMDIGREPESIHRMYGTRPGRTSFANNCLLARRLVERGVRFVQLYDWGWDSHGTDEGTALDIGFAEKCRQIDRPMTALIEDLRRRGLLEETLVVWGGEFGRTPMRENRGGVEMKFVGRDHHPEAFTIWMAGGGVRKGYVHGATDEIGYAPTRQQDRVHVHDLQATILHLIGMDHERLIYPFQGRDFRLTDVHGRVVREVLA